MTTSETATAPEDTRGSFRADVSPRGIEDAFRQYFARLRSGDPGGLPSVLGLLFLGLIFATTTDNFVGHLNAANLAAQSSFIALIALGLVFVLLVGEIDLSAGATAGMTAAFAAQGLHSGDLHHAVGNYVYWALAAGLAGAVVLGVFNRMIVAPAMVLVGLIVMLTGANENHQWFAFYFAVSISVAVGTFSGTLVTRLGIPSFIVTLALLLAWEGVKLYALKNQSVGTTNFSTWYKLTHGAMSVTEGWIFFGVLAGSYFAFTFIRSRMRRAAGLSADTIALVVVRALVVAAIGGYITYYLSQNRSPNDIVKIEGVPWAASVPITFMVFWTLWLAKTHWGRHLYAIGGNIEAANRAGMAVARNKINAFAICSGMAAVGGLFLADFSGGATTDLGGGDILLFAVAAAVIGGTSLFGGRGRPRDAIIGALVIATIPNGIHLHQFPEQANEVITGAVLLVAASVDAVSRRRAKAR